MVDFNELWLNSFSDFGVSEKKWRDFEWQVKWMFYSEAVCTYKN